MLDRGDQDLEAVELDAPRVRLEGLVTGGATWVGQEIQVAVRRVERQVLRLAQCARVRDNRDVLVDAA